MNLTENCHLPASMGYWVNKVYKCLFLGSAFTLLSTLQIFAALPNSNKCRTLPVEWLPQVFPCHILEFSHDIIGQSYNAQHLGLPGIIAETPSGSLNDCYSSHRASRRLGQDRMCLNMFTRFSSPLAIPCNSNQT